MKKVLAGLLCASFVGTAAAGDFDAMDARYADSNDYSAKVFYRMDFGGVNAASAQSVGLRFDNVLAESRGAPALFQAKFDGMGPTLALQGVDLRGVNAAAGQDGGGFFSGLTTAQWIGLGFTGLVFGTIVVEAADSDDTSGTGGY